MMFSTRSWSLLVILCCLMNIFVYADEDEYKTVNTQYGDVRGKLLNTLFDGGKYFAFQGIPYARPPINELRFKPPQPANNWAGIKDTFEYGNECVQTNYLTEQQYGHEDCLFVNVFVPVTKKAGKLLPVMFWIHGGGFMSGSSNPYGADFLVNNDVILVTFNYRLGPFGFLSLGTPEYSGNMGLKDQLLALKWVNENIERFGGDKKEITIFGESAGGASTHYHILSPKSRGLFRRAIPISGCALNTWAINYEQNHLKRLKKVAKNFRNAATNMDDLLQFIKTVDAHYFSRVTYDEMYVPNTGSKQLVLPWVPVVEVANTVEPFLDDYPENLAHSVSDDNIDVLFGYTSNEMLFYVGAEIKNPSILKPFDEKFLIDLPIKHLTFNHNSKEYQAMTKDIRQFYFANTNGHVNEKSLNEFSLLMSDLLLLYGIDRSTQIQHSRSSGKTILYKFSIETKINQFRALSGANEKNIPGASHADDAFHLFKVQKALFNEPYVDVYGDLKPDSVEVNTIRLMTRMWTNFAKFGNPDSTIIKPTTANEITFVDITNNGLVVGVNPSQKIITFWDDFYRKYKYAFNNIITGQMARDEL